jgi:hypothetical protein
VPVRIRSQTESVPVGGPSSQKRAELTSGSPRGGQPDEEADTGSRWWTELVDLAQIIVIDVNAVVGFYVPSSPSGASVRLGSSPCASR